MSRDRPGELTRHWVLRLRDGRYLSATGGLTPNRTDAARLAVPDVAQFLPARGWSDPLWGLSMEEVSKRERRRYQPMPGAAAAAMRADMIARVHRAVAADLRKKAEDAERVARQLRQQATVADGEPAPNRMIRLDEDL